MVKAHREQIVSAGGDLAKAFADRARTESDCSSARNGGDLGARSLVLSLIYS